MYYLNKYQWLAENNAFVTGFVWHGNKYYSENKFLELLQNNISGFGQFTAFVKELSGQFSIVIIKEDEIWACCCHTWSFPLFYQKRKETFAISDRPEDLFHSEEDKTINRLAKNYFLQFGVTPFNQTLSKTISQLRPGEIVCLKNNTDKIESDFLLKLHQQPSREITPREMALLLTSVFEKYYKTLKNKQVLLPLTRGYDSRLLACLLAEFGHKNVLCATWGRANNKEKHTAKKVAQKLGFNYRFVEYNNDLIKDFSNDQTFKAYVKHAAHWSSMPYMQDYFAIKYLLEKRLIDKNTVVLPGHPGDFLRGEHLDQSIFTITKDKLGKTFFAKLGTSFPAGNQKTKELQNLLDKQFFSEKSKPVWQVFEILDFEERQCKFISNSNQVYTYFGFDFMMPLFDKECIRFFQQISPRNQKRETLYNQTLESHFFKKQKVDFDLKNVQLKPTNRLKGLKNVLIKLAPHLLKTLYYPMNDNIFYREITKELRQNIKIKHPVKPHSFNAYIVQWYLHVLNSD